MFDIDLERDGKHHGWIFTGHSTDASAFGRLETPILSIRNGPGPRILCLGGVHGDEFPGQIVWTRLFQRLDPARLSGQLVILPAANVAAATAGTRLSPADDLDLNRIFPGAASGSPTQQLAHLIEQALIARSDFLIDLHSGSSASLYLPGPTVTACEDPLRMQRLIALLRVFGAPRGYVFDESRGGSAGTLGACRRHGIDRLGSEIGGGGIVSPADLALMEAGVLRVLIHLGVLDPALAATLPPPMTPRLFRRRGGSAGGYLHAPAAGLFEPRIELGDEVGAGQLLGEIHRPERPDQEPVQVHAPRAGVLMMRRRPGRTQPGDCLMILAEPFED